MKKRKVGKKCKFEKRIDFLAKLKVRENCTFLRKASIFKKSVHFEKKHNLRKAHSLKITSDMIMFVPLWPLLSSRINLLREYQSYACTVCT